MTRTLGGSVEINSCRFSSATSAQITSHAAAETAIAKSSPICIDVTLATPAKVAAWPADFRATVPSGESSVIRHHLDCGSFSNKASVINSIGGPWVRKRASCSQSRVELAATPNTSCATRNGCSAPIAVSLMNANATTRSSSSEAEFSAIWGSP